MFSKKTSVLILGVLIFSFSLCAEIKITDSNRYDNIKKFLKDALAEIEWAMGIYKDVKGSYQTLDKLAGDVNQEISAIIKGKPLEMLKECLTGAFKELLLSADYFRQYTTGKFGELLKKSLSVNYYFADTPEELDKLSKNYYLQNPKVKKHFDEIKKLKDELKVVTEESLEILTMFDELQDLVGKDGELKLIEETASQAGIKDYDMGSGKVVSVEKFWAVYGISEYKRMIKLFGTYAILEQRRKETLQKELLRMRGLSMQLSDAQPKETQGEK